MTSMEVRTHVRLPRELHAAVEEAADRAGVSFNMYVRLVLSRELGVPLRPHGNTKGR